MPTPIHQSMVFALGSLLGQALPDDFIVLPGVGVLVGDDEPIPDLIVCGSVISWEDRGIPADQVNLVVEVVSLATAAMDRKIKPEIYAHAGIPNYWRLERNRFTGQLPGEDLPVLFVYALGVDGEYELTHRCPAGKETVLHIPFDVTFDPVTLLP
ncbi:Uma2 family endonuclease [Nocardia sp. CDC153]|uniref:Uma2 family endonuclease n=1 Tax=Nocardia sp. CDC153 TaxID=3112167 RepID=UPI002DB9D154|nr:Uma2 family endonuclease [Nocardia sp. CDC153]MEC3951699.1 Uma2 family endonuclease [Nocardia sp. CDC153]